LNCAGTTLGWTPPYDVKHRSDRKTTTGKQTKLESNHRMKNIAKTLAYSEVTVDQAAKSATAVQKVDYELFP